MTSSSSHGHSPSVFPSRDSLVKYLSADIANRYVLPPRLQAQRDSKLANLICSDLLTKRVIGQYIALFQSFELLGNASAALNISSHQDYY